MESFAKSTLVGSHDRFLWRHPPTLGPTRGSSFSIYQWGLSRTRQKTTVHHFPTMTSAQTQFPGHGGVAQGLRAPGIALSKNEPFHPFPRMNPPRSAYYRFIARSHNLLLEWHPQIIPTQRRNDHPRLSKEKGLETFTSLPLPLEGLTCWKSMMKDYSIFI